MYKLLTLEEILLNAQILSHSLYLKGNPPWDAETLGAVYFDETEDEFDEEFSKFAQDNKLRSIYNLQTVQDIVDNVRFQTTAPTINQLVNAFNYYYLHDSFLRLV